jgi:3-oxoadipyl-CoA thiolase
LDLRPEDLDQLADATKGHSSTAYTGWARDGIKPAFYSSRAMRTAYLVDAVRTPIGKFKGALASVRPDDLAAHVLSALLARNPAVAGRLDQVIFGATNQAGEDNRNVARMAVLLADLPYEVPAVTVNRLCGSGLEAVTDAAMRVMVGDADAVVAGGVESMTRAPFTMRKSEEPFARDFPKVYDTTIGWRFENPRMAARFPLHSMGETAENVADKWKIGREEQDRFALESQRKAGAALAAGAFDREIVPVPVPQKKGDPIAFAKDESPRPDTTPDALAKLAPVFRKGGTVTAGNSSPINDGASAVLVVSEEVLRAERLEPLARVVSFATSGVEPNFMGEGPIPAGKKALARASWKQSDLDLVELNEAFAAQSIACIRGLELDPAKVNPNGGAIALGHPIGSSGCRILGTLLWSMKARGAKRGMAALCIGVGQGIAMCVEA